MFTAGFRGQWCYVTACLQSIYLLSEYHVVESMLISRYLDTYIGADPGFSFGGGGGERLRTRALITSAQPNVPYGLGPCRARLMALEALGVLLLSRAI